VLVQARKYSGVRKVLEWWDGDSSDSKVDASGAGASSIETGGEGGHVYEPLEALNAHMRIINDRMHKAMRCVGGGGGGEMCVCVCATPAYVCAGMHT
jgi:hypothetical protein